MMDTGRDSRWEKFDDLTSLWAAVEEKFSQLALPIPPEVNIEGLCSDNLTVNLTYCRPDKGGKRGMCIVTIDREYKRDCRPICECPVAQRVVAANYVMKLWRAARVLEAEWGERTVGACTILKGFLEIGGKL